MLIIITIPILTASYQSHIVAILDMWGGLPLPSQYFGLPDQSGFFTGSNGNAYNPPLIAFAGAKDNVFSLFPFKNNIPNNAQKVFFSPTYFSESRCLPYDPPNSPYVIDGIDNGLTDLDMGSTYNMYLILTTLGVKTEMYIDCQMHHGLDKDCDCDPNPYNKDNMGNCTVSCLYQSDFRTGDHNTTQTETYMVQRACVFFSMLLIP